MFDLDPFTHSGVSAVPRVAVKHWTAALSLVTSLRVRGESMGDALQDGAVISVTSRRARLGEVCVFRSQHGLVVHRVVFSAFGYVLCRGDACAAVDAVHHQSDVVGVVPGVPSRPLWAFLRAPVGVARRLWRHLELSAGAM